MTDTKLQAVSKKIYELVPRLKELSFGCEFSDGSILLDIWHPFATDTIVNVYYPSTKGEHYKQYTTQGVEPNHAEIIGHPITLEDVLEALGKVCDRSVAIKVTDLGLTYLYFDNKTSKGFHISKPLDQQSEETITFLHSILCQ